MACCLGVSDRAVDNWLDGKNRPTPEKIAAIADALARHTRNATAEQLELEIHRQFTFAHIADLLVPWIGRESVIELSSALIRFVWLITEDVESMERRPIEEAAGAELAALRFGTAHSSTHTLLRNLALTESDVNWKRDILALGGDWGLAFQVVALRSTRRRSAAGLAQDVLDMSPQASPRLFPAPSDPAAEALWQLAVASEDPYRLHIQGNVTSPVRLLDDGIALRRAIVRDFPLSPKAHFELGSFLGMAGRNLQRRDLIDEGVGECWIAAALLPGWDAPAVEPGVILANVGKFKEALKEFERAKDYLREATPHLQFSTGYVLMNLSIYAEALEQLEEVIDAKSDHALAFLYAAHCAFRLGDKLKGIRYAKSARRLGEPGEYIAWKRGEYSSRGR